MVIETNLLTGWGTMKKIRGLDWSAQGIDSNTALIQYRKYLERLGLKPNTINLYKLLIKKYLKFLGERAPTV